MTRHVTSITATGTRGHAKGILFVAKPDRFGRFVLNRKTSSPVGGNTTNHAKNKICVSTIDEAARLLETDEYLINLVSREGKRALREYKKVRIEARDD